MGLLGFRRTIAASPDLINLGLSSVDFPVRRSTFSDLSKLASNVRCVAIKDRTVSVGHLTRVVEDNDLSSEVLNSRSWLVLGIRGDISSLDILHGHVLDVEPNVVSWGGLGERLVVHLHGLNLSGQLIGSESND